jgi:pimeloyl-ACP methyl ester carboxylesterase
MAISGGGQQDSGLDRALQVALKAELDEVLLSGELWTGEREQFPTPIAAAESDRPWQVRVGDKFDPPGKRSSILGGIASEVSRLLRRPPTTVPSTDVKPRNVRRVPPIDKAAYDKAVADNFPRARNPKVADRQRRFEWRPERTGIVVIHGIGPQLAGQTLLDWVRPIITLLGDAAPKKDFVAPGKVTDPVLKSNIDFSGETFPVLQVNVPGWRNGPADDPRRKPRTWVFTETWWAAEVRPPSLTTMVSWLGEQGGVGRILDGIQGHMFGSGWATFVASSLRPFISIITSFVLLVFVLLLGLAKLIPFGPLRDAVVLRLAASFLTDWFGGARTLLLDPAQSANVRHRLVMTIKALRAYGCRDVVIIAHSGGTMVSLMTLTDPAFKTLRVQKLITIGEALNLGWRLNDEDPDDDTLTPPEGDRMRGDLGDPNLAGDLQWRDFFGTHDPAPSGPPTPPEGFTKPPDVSGEPLRFSTERVYNRLGLLEDHGTYWDNDEQFLIPLIREIDVPTGDRGASRFYSDGAEDSVRTRRKERVSLLALWRRALQSLPVLAIVAAATVSAPGFVAIAGDIAFTLFGLIPGNEIVAGFFNSFVTFFNSIPLTVPFVETETLGAFLYLVGTWTLEAILILFLVAVVVPSRLDRHWPDKPLTRLAVLTLELWVGAGVALSLVFTYFLVLSPAEQAHIVTSLRLDVGVLIVLVAGLFVAGAAGKWARGWLRTIRTEQEKELQTGEPGERHSQVGRSVVVTVSALFLAIVLIALIGVVIGVVLVIVDGTPAHRDTERFVVGAIAILVAFRLLTSLGTWRWNAWDVRERRSLRQRPLEDPSRKWPFLVSLVLTLIAFAATLLVALGADGSTWIGVDRDTWIVGIGFAIVAVILVSLGKDIVDSDTTVVSRSDAGGGDTGTPPAMSTPEPPKGAGG